METVKSAYDDNPNEIGAACLLRLTGRGDDGISLLNPAKLFGCTNGKLNFVLVRRVSGVVNGMNPPVH